MVDFIKPKVPENSQKIESIAYGHILFLDDDFGHEGIFMKVLSFDTNDASIGKSYSGLKGKSLKKN